MKKLFSFVFIAVLYFTAIQASFSQVTVTATAGNPGPTVYSTLGAAFTAINSGTHQGDLIIFITSSTVEGTTPATLNSSGAGTASYTSVLIQPSNDGITISGNPAAGYGIIQLNGADNVTINGDNPNTGGINRNLTISNTAAPNIIAGSVIRIATSTAVTSADNNTIKNCILISNVTGGNSSGNAGTSTSSNSSFGIYAGGKAGATVIGAPANITSVTADVAPTGTTINNLLIDNNSVNQCARAIVFNGNVAAVSNGVTITNNLVGDQAATLSGNPPYTSPSTTVYTKGIWIAGTNSITITGNTLKNILSYVGTAMSAIELTSGIGSGAINVSGNTVNGLVQNSATSGSAARAIYLNNGSASLTVSGNIISNIQTLGSAGNIAIDISVTSSSGSVQNNKISNIYNRSANAYLSYGININGGNNLTIQNNFISDINMVSGNTVTSTTSEPVGLRISSGAGHKIYHNSINLYGPPLGGSAANGTSCLMIVNSASTGMDIRNNIFSNQYSGWPAGSVHACIYMPSALTSSFNLVANNNGYYAGSGNFLSQLSSGSAYTISAFNPASTSDTANWRHYSGALLAANTNNDNSSIGSSGAPPFTSAANLHIPAGTSTLLESSGASSTGVSTDIDGESRPGPIGSSYGGGFANDIGADEFDGIPSDLIPPVITYTPLSATDSTSNRRFAYVSVTDALSGVNSVSGTKPRCYYKRTTDANTYAGNTSTNNGWKWTEANGLVSPFDFTMDYNLLFGGCGIAPGDIIQYFVVAQDLSSIPNIAINSGAFAGTPASVNLAVSDFPITGVINQFIITAPAPVNMCYFTGIASGRDVFLSWQTSCEINNKGFEIYRRAININTFSPWVKAGFIYGNGTTNELKSYAFKDPGLPSGKFQYRLKQIDYNSNFEYYDLNNPDMIEIGKPIWAGISQNYPNPSNPNSKIDYQIPFNAKVSIRVFDITGKEVAELLNEVKEAGFFTAEFDGSNFASGVYFYRIIAEGDGQRFTQTKKIVLVK